MAFVKLADNYTDLIGKFAVALLAEGVDRNISRSVTRFPIAVSPSSRRAWIEIVTWHHPTLAVPVALLAEGVDRNSSSTSLAAPTAPSRPPRGGRG